MHYRKTNLFNIYSFRTHLNKFVFLPIPPLYKQKAKNQQQQLYDIYMYVYIYILNTFFILIK